LGSDARAGSIPAGGTKSCSLKYTEVWQSWPIASVLKTELRETVTGVRIPQLPQKMPLSFNWIGHGPSKAIIGVRIPVGVQIGPLAQLVRAADS
jgi:hypothetical protein